MLLSRFAAASLALAAFLLCLPCLAHANGQDWTRPEFSLLVNTAPKIDGELSDPCWKTALKAEAFSRFTGGSPVTQPTEAFVTTDGTFLYVAFYCHDSELEKIRASETQRGSQAVFQDDHITVLLDSQNTHRGVSIFSVNPRGTQIEQLEGGSADNITWSGDWKAATKRVTDGWTAELAIPFAMLRHPKNSQSFGLLLGRYLNRESNETVWPALPIEGQSFFTRAQYLPQITLSKPMADVTPRPVFLPYTLATAGSVSAAREGLDIKYPITTTLTGLATLFPDFRTIEQDVASVNFSYNEQFIADRRPFFAEGNEFLPEPTVFYSRRIKEVDEGVKFVGRNGLTSIGFLTTGVQSTAVDRVSSVLNIKQQIGLFSDYSIAFAADNRSGALDNRVLRTSGSTGWVDSSGRRNTFFLGRSQSYEGGKARGGASDFNFFSRGLPGTPRIRISRSILSSDFVSSLGLLQDRDRSGWSTGIGQRNQFDRGSLLGYEVNVDYLRSDRLTSGDFFREEYSFDANLQTRNGYKFGVRSSDGRRSVTPDLFYDRSIGIELGWNQRTLFQSGGLFLGRGKKFGQAINTIGFGQSILISKPFSVKFAFSEEKRDGTPVRQNIITGTYRLSALEAISGRWLTQNGAGNASDDGARVGTNLYLAYSRRSRKGTDLFLILGDPNAGKTRAQVTVKLTRPY
jgi:hypothetical protein